ncbi:glycoside hydrolase family 15 protein [Robbsia sp. Bb-Pol-6]|uniref:Glycoside hydrolase family 15 protein n=1 Tax=Robbsia betulipollinis TaxID=2981849 RepID=A0ABT3ZNR3_9BURK|nr:glycoside hydrolase family 15 protein [Robbsia betulipollinis]MCY0388183.1 glycoside hydrolase family 15 protein [Robbsia betulipollinis]
MNAPHPSAHLRATYRDPDGFLPLEGYGALGDGRSVALSGTDGSIDWWCVPGIGSPPLFDRLLDAREGGYFEIVPDAPFEATRRYRENSNVLETVFSTAGGRARLVESHNSGSAGRLPWSELARRLEGLEGQVRFVVRIVFSRRADAINPYFASAGPHDVFHADRVLGLFLHSDGVHIEQKEDTGILATVSVGAGEHETLAIVAGEDEPLVVPDIGEIDARIERSDAAWREWAGKLRYEGEFRALLVRSALALKLLLYSPSGAIAAAATTSLPERIGGDKNFDYRFAWIRDAGYTIKAFLRIRAQEEAKAAFTWLLRQLQQGEEKVLYALEGGEAPALEDVGLDGYRGSAPVVTGNAATSQHQHGIYGDIFETAARFVAYGNILDARSAETLSHLADACADRWRRKDAGIWELQEPQHYTMSKISAWQALARAVELADGGQLPTTCRDRWCRERDRVAAWIETHCWSEARGAYLFYPESDELDASLALAVRFGFDSRERLRRTLDAVDRELGAGAFHYRYGGMQDEEGCFLACTFWMVEARALLGQTDQARAAFVRAVAALDHGVGIYSEMVDPDTGAYLGNLPQGLTHLALIHAVSALSGDEP